MRVLVIGGGLFGCCIASELSAASHSVDLVECNADLMGGASFHNHNRLHLGYHYLRSPETARQSIEGYLTFGFYFGECVITNFENYYAIAKDGSKSSTKDFEEFCNSVGIGYDLRYPDARFLDPDMLDSCFLVPEPVFDYWALKKRVVDMMKRSRVHLFMNTKCESLRINRDSVYVCRFNDGQIKFYDAVVNASYVNINVVEEDLGLVPRMLMFQNVIIPVFEHGNPRIGLTVMDGNFCSVMPQGRQDNRFLLYHVVNSVIRQNYGERLEGGLDSPTPGDVARVFQESSVFMPFLADVRPVDLLHTVRVVRNSVCDARVSEINMDDRFPRYFSVLSGKIATCMNVALKIKKSLASQTASVPVA